MTLENSALAFGHKPSSSRSVHYFCDNILLQGGSGTFFFFFLSLANLVEVCCLYYLIVMLPISQLEKQCSLCLCRKCEVISSLRFRLLL